MNLSNETVINKAKSFGFDLVGFARAASLDFEFDNLKEWLKRGYHAGMEYMDRNAGKRKNVKEILPSAKSVISLAVNYYTDAHHDENPKGGKVSRYAWGRDYHYVIWAKLENLINELQAIDPGFEANSYVDTGPVMDKAWAVRSGIGWLGKHTNVISREIGSWFFIANIITNREFIYNEPVADFCGSCTACLDACPTDAIIGEYVVDSNKCISYLTIENKGDIPGEFKEKFDNWAFGCDICQDVCPWNNKFFRETENEDFYPKGNKEIIWKEIEDLSNKTFNEKFHQSPILRARLKGIKRNMQFIDKDEEL